MIPSHQHSFIVPFHVLTVNLARVHRHTGRNGECRGAEPLAGSVRACPESIEGVSLTNRNLSGEWVGNVNVC